MLDNILKECQTAWIKTKTKRNHAFRYFSLATTAIDGTPETRMVVLRNFDATDYHFTIYTDARTPKMKSLHQQPSAELLFYDHKKLLQIRVKAVCIESRKDPDLFAQQHEGAQKDYTTSVAPGTPAKGMDQVVYTEENHFTVLVFKAQSIDYLRLKRPNHQRAFFRRNEQRWEGTFLTP
ncbi:MAG: pyridoxamine 5'-phosphate oxidase family protein [Flavobacteriaceae bacterium]